MTILTSPAAQSRAAANIHSVASLLAAAHIRSTARLRIPSIIAPAACLLALSLLAAAGCSESARTASTPADAYAALLAADAAESMASAGAASASATEVRQNQIQVPETLLSHAQSAGSRSTGNYYAPLPGSGYTASAADRAAASSAVASDSRSSSAVASSAADSSSAPAVASVRRAEVRVYNAILAPPPVVGAAGVVAYRPQTAAIPVGATLVVQAAVSADLRYVNMNIQPQLVGVPTFQNVPVNFGF
jgi:hypothetical protein